MGVLSLPLSVLPAPQSTVTLSFRAGSKCMSLVNNCLLYQSLLQALVLACFLHLIPILHPAQEGSSYTFTQMIPLQG